MFYGNTNNLLLNKNKRTSLAEIAFMAAIALICFIGFACSAEMAAYTGYFLIAVAICLFSPKMVLIIYMIPFLYIMPSVSNNPSVTSSSVFSSTANIIYLACIAVIALALIIARIIQSNVGKKHSLPKLTVGFVFLGVSYMLSGVGSGFESFQNLVYAIAQIASLCMFYFIALFAVDWEKTSKSGFAWMGFFVGLVLLLEICYIYITQDGGFFEIASKRGPIYTGWGMYNNIGGYLIMTIPCLFYLACTQKDSWLYLVWACIFSVGVIFTTSRGSILTGAGVFVLSGIASIILTKDRGQRAEIAITFGVICVAAFVAAVVLLFKSDSIRSIVETLISYKDSNRFNLYRQGIEQFRKHPIFGAGFYECDVYQFGNVDIVIPPRWHNTFVQLLATGGIVCLAAYLFHRVQSVVMLAKKRTVECVFIGLCVLAMLVSGMVDNHLFNFGPGILSSILFAFAEGLPTDKIILKKRKKSVTD